MAENPHSESLTPTSPSSLPEPIPDSRQQEPAGGWPLLLPVAVAILIALAYAPVMRSGFIWDDDDYVTQNTLLRDWGGLRDIWMRPKASPQYYPMTFSSFWLEYRLWGASPGGYHFTNVMLHALSTLVLWRVMRRLNVPAAGLAAAIFALHPVCVESVAWVTERKNVLSGLLYLLSALAYVHFDLPTPERQPRRWRWYALATALFAAALLSKTVTCTLPAALMLLYWWKRRRLAWRDAAPLVPLLLLGVVMGLMTAVLEGRHVGASGPEWHFTLGERFIIAGRALWFYAGKLIWPHPLVFIYPRWQIQGASPWFYLYPLSAAAAIVALFLPRRRIGKGPLVAVLFFAGTLLPALGFVNVYPMRFSFVADHFQYLACIGLIGLAASILWRIGGHVSRHRLRLAASAGAIALMAGLAALTWKQCQIYRDARTLWEATLVRNPSSWMVNANLGYVIYTQGNKLAARGRSEEALAAYQRGDRLVASALRLNPAVGLVYYDHSLVLTALGRKGEAKAALEKALALDPDSSWASVAHNNLGALLMEEGRMAEGATQFRRAVQIDPSSALFHQNLGQALLRSSQYDLAADEFRQAWKIEPAYKDAVFSLGLALESAGRLQEAADSYREALRLDPKDQDTHQRLSRLVTLLRTTSQATSGPTQPPPP